MPKLKDVLQHKNIGDEWFSFLAPEQYHKWDVSNPWDFKEFRKLDVSLLSVAVQSNEDVPNTKNITKFSLKDPYYLEKTGVEIVEGHIGTKVKRMGSAKFRCDGVIELNRIMKELSQKSGISFWWIISMEISNNKSGGIVTFRRHNPDGHGVSLFLWRIKTEDYSKLYPDISLNEQHSYIGKFRGFAAKCQCSQETTKTHGCSIDKSVHKIIKK